MAMKDWKLIRRDGRALVWRSEEKDTNVSAFANPLNRGWSVEVDEGIGKIRLLTPKFKGSSTGQLTKSQAVFKAKQYMRRN